MDRDFRVKNSAGLDYGETDKIVVLNNWDADMPNICRQADNM